MKIKTSIQCLAALLMISHASYSPAVQTVINNNISTPPAQPAQPSSTCNNGPSYDPRVPPAGAYIINTGNGSSQQLYTTGETKPYIVDNNCNSQQTPIVQPNVWQQQQPWPPGQGPGPGPRSRS